jgi:hypothetical protein
MSEAMAFMLFLFTMLVVLGPLAKWLTERDYQRNCPREFDPTCRSNPDPITDPLLGHPFSQSHRRGKRSLMWAPKFK